MNNETQPIEESLFLNQNIKYILSILNDDIKSSSWLLSNGVHKIGRLEDKEIILEDITVSKNHAYISVEDDELEIYDEGSTNGIFVNGELVDSAKLFSGTRLQIGKYYLDKALFKKQGVRGTVIRVKLVAFLCQQKNLMNNLPVHFR